MGLSYDKVAQHSAIRSSHPEVFCKKDVLKNIAKFTGKHLCQSLFFNKVTACPSPSTLLKKRIWLRCFSVNFAKLLKKAFLYRIPLAAASEHYESMNKGGNFSRMDQVKFVEDSL